MYHSLFIHSPIKTYLGSICFLALMNKTTICIEVKGFVFENQLDITKSIIARLVRLILTIRENCQTVFFSFFFFLSFVFCLFWVAPMAYKGSQARGLIRATATPDPSCVCSLHHRSRQHRILNPLSQGSNPHLMVPSWIRFC